MDAIRDSYIKWNNLERAKYHMISLMCGIQNMSQMNLSTKQKQTHRCREQTSCLPRGLWLIDAKLLHLEWISNEVLLYNSTTQGTISSLLGSTVMDDSMRKRLYIYTISQLYLKKKHCCFSEFQINWVSCIYMATPILGNFRFSMSVRCRAKEFHPIASNTQNYRSIWFFFNTGNPGQFSNQFHVWIV